MRDRVFQAGGAIPPDSPTYVERDADKLVLLRVQQMEYVHIVVARQMGKTCLLYRLASRLPPDQYQPVWVDLAGIAGLEMSRWYEAVGEEIGRRLTPASMPRLSDQKDLQDYLLNLMQAIAGTRNVVVILDEIDSTRGLHFSDGFFSALRTLYNRRVEEPSLRHLTFIMVGATDPRRLIKDPNLSPFNVGEEVRLEEFTAEETRRLTDNLSLVGIEADEATHARIYWWTSGQPYLTQRVCATLEDWHTLRGLKRATPELVDRAVEEAILSPEANDSNIAHIKARLELAPGARAYLQRIFEGEVIPFEPNGAVNGRLAELYLIGVVKKGPEGNTVVRNRIYEETLRNYVRLASEAERASLRTRLEIHRRNLRYLEERKAKYGLDAPLSLLNQIEAERAAIERIERELGK